MSKASPIQAAIFNTAVSGGAGILTNPFQPSRASVAVRCTVALSGTDTTFGYTVHDGTTTLTVLFDTNNVGLRSRNFVFTASKTDTSGNALSYDFVTGAGTTVAYFHADEIDEATT